MLGIRHSAKCDGCFKQITSIRYKCKQCEDYSLCTRCRGTGIHRQNGHTFFTIGGNRVCNECNKNINVYDQSKKNYKCFSCIEWNLCEDCNGSGVHGHHQLLCVQWQGGVICALPLATSNNYNSNFSSVATGSQQVKFTMKNELPKIESATEISHLHKNDRNMITIVRKIGQGKYGALYKGLWKNNSVAIKLLQKGTTDMQYFVKQLAIIKKLEHNNVMILLGVISRQESVLIVTEFMDQGSLATYLQKSKNKLPVPTLIWIALEVADGMLYLHSKNYVHSNLSARNVLVGSAFIVPLTIKITCDIPRSTSCSVITGIKCPSNIFPLRWTAPEAMPPEKQFTPKSDVWSFGILLTEIFTFGCCPYPNVPNEYIEKYVKAGKMMSSPAGCSPYICSIIKSTWKMNAHDRPTFQDIRTSLRVHFQKLHMQDP